jgi:hypothetical protein
VTVLEFSAVDFDKRSRVAEENFGRCLNDARLAGTGWTKEQQVADRATGHVHSCQVNLVHVHDAFDSAFLPYDFSQKSALEIQDFGAPHFGIQLYFF